MQILPDNEVLQIPDVYFPVSSSLIIQCQHKDRFLQLYYVNIIPISR
jgi:hypothetical protein